MSNSAIHLARTPTKQSHGMTVCGYGLMRVVNEPEHATCQRCLRKHGNKKGRRHKGAVDRFIDPAQVDWSTDEAQALLAGFQHWLRTEAAPRYANTYLAVSHEEPK